MPLSPCTRSRGDAWEGGRPISQGTFNTAGRPSARAMIAACEKGTPSSTTITPAVRNNGVHAGSVVLATRMSPGSIGSVALVMMRALPS